MRAVPFDFVHVVSVPTRVLERLLQRASRRHTIFRLLTILLVLGNEPEGARINGVAISRAVCSELMVKSRELSQSFE